MHRGSVRRHRGPVNRRLHRALRRGLLLPRGVHQRDAHQLPRGHVVQRGRCGLHALRARHVFGRGRDSLHRPPFFHRRGRGLRPPFAGRRRRALRAGRRQRHRVLRGPIVGAQRGLRCAVGGRRAGRRLLFLYDAAVGAGRGHRVHRGAVGVRQRVRAVPQRRARGRAARPAAAGAPLLPAERPDGAPRQRLCGGRQRPRGARKQLWRAGRRDSCGYARPGDARAHRVDRLHARGRQRAGLCGRRRHRRALLQPAGRGRARSRRRAVCDRRPPHPRRRAQRRHHHRRGHGRRGLCGWRRGGGAVQQPPRRGRGRRRRRARRGLQQPRGAPPRRGGRRGCHPGGLRRVRQRRGRARNGGGRAVLPHGARAGRGRRRRRAAAVRGARLRGLFLPRRKVRRQLRRRGHAGGLDGHGRLLLRKQRLVHGGGGRRAGRNGRALLPHLGARGAPVAAGALRHRLGSIKLMGEPACERGAPRGLQRGCSEHRVRGAANRPARWRHARVLAAQRGRCHLAGERHGRAPAGRRHLLLRARDAAAERRLVHFLARGHLHGYAGRAWRVHHPPRRRRAALISKRRRGGVKRRRHHRVRARCEQGARAAAGALPRGLLLPLRALCHGVPAGERVPRVLGRANALPRGNVERRRVRRQRERVRGVPRGRLLPARQQRAGAVPRGQRERCDGRGRGGRVRALRCGAGERLRRGRHVARGRALRRGLLLRGRRRGAIALRLPGPVPRGRGGGALCLHCVGAFNACGLRNQRGAGRRPRGGDL
jgi:hypothetical protein